MDVDHVCKVQGMQMGTKVTCKHGEISCTKNLGGIIEPERKFNFLFACYKDGLDYCTILIYFLYFQRPLALRCTLVDAVTSQGRDVTMSIFP